MIDRKTDNLLSQLARLRQEVEAFKAAQPVSGDSWAIYKNRTNEEWDIIDTPPGTAQTFKIYEVRLHPSNPEVPGFAAFYLNVTWDNIQNPGWYDVVRVVNDPYAWLVSTGNGRNDTGTNTIYLKFYLYATQSGTVTITEL